jgi:hypothetical protein
VPYTCPVDSESKKIIRNSEAKKKKGYELAVICGNDNKDKESQCKSHTL